MAWSNIVIDDISTYYSERVVNYWCNWCDSLASYTVTRESDFSQNTYTDFCCSECANKWKQV